jgi:hypothetical protein
MHAGILARIVGAQNETRLLTELNRSAASAENLYAVHVVIAEHLGRLPV